MPGKLEPSFWDVVRLIHVRTAAMGTDSAQQVVRRLSTASLQADLAVDRHLSGLASKHQHSGDAVMKTLV